jgi:holliday junction DNA helicase RuvA
MIGRIVGNIVDKNPYGVLVDVAGVGYEITLPLSTLAGLPATGESVSLSIHTHVREDDLRLFGFVSDQDRETFRTLIKISGVGPKLALTVLGGLSGNDLAQVIQERDAKRLTSIPGIGKKTAERMILELGGKLVSSNTKSTPAGGSALGDLDSALKNLGFKPAQVDRVLAEVEQSGGIDRPFEVLLRQALGLLKKSN